MPKLSFYRNAGEPKYVTHSRTVGKLGKKDLSFTVKPKQLVHLTNTTSKTSDATFTNVFITFQESIKNHKIKIPEDNNEFVQLTMTLFYTKNGVELPKIYTLMQDIEQLEQLIDGCNIIENRLKEYKVCKHNSIFKNQENFQLFLLTAIQAARGHLTKIQNLHELNNKKLHTEFNESLSKIELLTEIINGGGGVLDPKTGLLQGGLPTCALYNTLSDFGPSADELGDIYGLNSPHEIPIAATVNTGAEVLAGVACAFYKGTSRGLSIITGQAIGIHKQYLLYLIHSLYERNIQLTPAEERQIEKFLQFKRGGIVSKIFTRTTTSMKAFNRLRQIHDRGAQKISSGKSYYNYSCEEGSDTTMVHRSHSEEFVSFTTAKAELKSLLKNNRRSDLLRYMQTLPTTTKQQIPQMVFEIGGFRGGLLEHINLDDNQKLKKELECELELIYLKEELVQKMLNLQYTDFYNHIKSYKPINKYTASKDISQLLFAIRTNKNLDDREKSSLVQILQDELAKKSTGNFVQMRIKRSMFGTDATLAAISYQGLNIKRDTQAIEGYFTDQTMSMSISASNVMAGGAGWALFSLLVPTNEYFSRGNTKTFESLSKVVNARQRQLMESTTPNKKKDEDKIHFSRMDNNKSSTIIQDLRDEIHNNIIKQELVLSKLECLPSKMVYSVLNEDVEDSFLLDKLFNKFEGDNLLRLHKVWFKSLRATKPEIIKDCNELAGFRRYTAKTSADNAMSALRSYYEVIALISIETDKDKKAAKLEHFAGIIFRAKSDNTSKWYNLRKRTANQELLLRSLVRISGAVIWGSVSTITTLSGVGLAIAIPLLLLCDGLRGVIYGASRNFTHTDTTQYKTTEKILDLFPTGGDNDYIELAGNNIQQKLQTQMTHPIHYQKLLSVVEAGRRWVDDNYRLSIEGSSLTEYFRRCDAEFIEDQKYIDIMNNGYAEHSEKESMNDLFLDKLQVIINNISSEAADKYLANQCLFRIVRIIDLSSLSKVEKFKLSLVIIFLFNERMLDLSTHISKERDFTRKRKFFIPDFLFGITAASTTLSGLGANPISGVYKTLCGGCGDLIGTLSLSLMLNEYEKNNTRSYQKDMSFLKYWIMDNYFAMTIDDTISLRKTDWDNYKEYMESFLRIQTGRVRLSETKTLKMFQQHLPLKVDPVVESGMVQK